MKGFKYWFTILALVVALGVNNRAGAQEVLSTRSKKAVELYHKAQYFYDRYSYAMAIQSLEQAVLADPKFVQAYLFLSQMHQDMLQFHKAIECGDKALAINDKIYPEIRYSLGQMKLMLGMYREALSDFQQFKEIPKIPHPKLIIADSLIVRCNYGIQAMEHPVPFNPVNLGDSVNSEYDDYWPSISADEKTLVITSNIPRDTLIPYSEKNRQEDFFISTQEDGHWTDRRPLGPPINSEINEGAQSLTADGKAMYFTICSRNCNLFYSKKTGGKWGMPVALPEPVSSKYSTKQPSISPDGRTLYFSSNRPGGKGGFDLWLSHLLDNGQWTEPLNLGDSINTKGNEFSPFIHFDNVSLYFSSDGHMGMGGQDIYVSHKVGANRWSTPVNAGYPINTYQVEDGLVVSAKGDHAYFSSIREGSRMRDIYMFELPQAIRPTPVSYIKGNVINSKTSVPIAAKASLIDLVDNKALMEASSDPETGEFLVCIPAHKSYGFTVEHPGYLFYSDNFKVDGDYDIEHPLERIIKLVPIKAGESVILRNIFFAVDSWQLLPESHPELEKVLELLSQNPTTKIEVSGHTDNTGTLEHNQSLSENRAKAVVDYLVSKGVDSSRLTFKGDADTKPIADNSTPEHRAMNRRTEMKVLE